MWLQWGWSHRRERMLRSMLLHLAADVNSRAPRGTTGTPSWDELCSGKACSPAGWEENDRWIAVLLVFTLVAWEGKQSGHHPEAHLCTAWPAKVRHGRQGRDTGKEDQRAERASTENQHGDSGAHPPANAGSSAREGSPQGEFWAASRCMLLQSCRSWVPATFLKGHQVSHWSDFLCVPGTLKRKPLLHGSSGRGQTRQVQPTS